MQKCNVHKRRLKKFTIQNVSIKSIEISNDDQDYIEFTIQNVSIKSNTPFKIIFSNTFTIQNVSIKSYKKCLEEVLY